jgi:hypothetical protein
MLTTIGNTINDIVAALLLAIPRIIGFLLILLIGWIIAGLLARLVGALLRTIRFNDMAARAGITRFVQSMGVNTDPAGVLVEIVKWFIRLLTLVVAFDALGLPAVSAVIQSFLLWIPNLVVALVIIVIAGLLANVVGDVVRGASAQAGLGNPNLLAGIARVAILAFGVIAAVNQLGIATVLVDTLFMGLVAALALALGLAFGLGGRDTAGQIVQNWYQQTREAAPRIAQAAESAGQQAKETTELPETYAQGNRAGDGSIRIAPTPRGASQEPDR